MFASVVARELSIITVIALLVLGGSQLPKIVRALGESVSGAGAEAPSSEG